jgi:hypothetical protein
MLFLSVIIILYFVFRFNPVDLLLTCFLIYYLYFLYHQNYSFTLYGGVICGFLGSLAYLTKSFALPFFLVTFILFNLLYYFKDFKQKRIIIKNLFLGLTVFFLISGIWAGIISEKYGYPTFGNSGKYNLNEIGPLQQKQGSPIWHGFIEPSNEKSSSAWEDPSYLKISSWSPLESFNSFKYEINVIKDNINKTMIYFIEFSYLSLIILVFYILLVLINFKNLFSKKNYINLLFPFLTVLIFIAFYVLIFVEFRYFYLIYFLLILMGFYLMQELFNKNFCNLEMKSILLLVFIFSIIIVPVTSLISNIDSGKGTYELANQINNQYHLKGNVASNDGYMASLFVCYLCGAQYYGTSLKNWGTVEDSILEQDLQDYNIDYYLYWGDSNYNPNVLSRYKEITGGKFKDLKIYYIKERI